MGRKGVFLLVILLILCSFIFNGCTGNIDEEINDSLDEIPDEVRCSVDEDCVPAACCHPDSCVNINSRPICKAILCTADCAPGTMDCGQGRCVCEENKCLAKIG
ncbi:MAG: hypothetical protein KAK00_03920 [Nanoarchaeota archaeon]|nr:hypothetical protein [Nanoarchaeota archaeon]